MLKTRGQKLCSFKSYSHFTFVLQIQMFEFCCEFSPLNGGVSTPPYVFCSFEKKNKKD